MLACHEGGSQDDGPVVGNGGYCDGTFVVVRSHDVAQGGVNMVVRAASGAVGVDIAIQRASASDSGSSSAASLKVPSTSYKQIGQSRKKEGQTTRPGRGGRHRL